MNRKDLLAVLNAELRPEMFRDYAPNGLQVEGAETISHIVTAVSASLATIDAALAMGADTLLVHHGYFWKGEDARLVGMKRRRLARLIENNVNLIAYHLPLDAHAVLGNNAQLAADLGWRDSGERCGDQDLVWIGECATAPADKIAAHVGAVLGVKPLLLGDAALPVSRVAWCSGGADSYFLSAVEAGVDLFLTGEVSEPCVHIAEETGVRFLSAGHHATERGGVRALGQWLETQTGVKCSFIDLFHPV